MNQSNELKYLSSLSVVKSMFIAGIITMNEYKKSESFLAKRYSIKIGNPYRQNELLYEPERVIYGTEEKEDSDGKNS